MKNKTPTTDFATRYSDGNTSRSIITCKDGINSSLEITDYPNSVTQELIFRNGKAISYYSCSNNVESFLKLEGDARVIFLRMFAGKFGPIFETDDTVRQYLGSAFKDLSAYLN